MPAGRCGHAGEDNVKNNRKFRNLSLYYRDESGTMRKVPGIKLLMLLEKYGGGMAKVYTFTPWKEQEISLED